jgi:ATP synthase protein I
MLKASSTQIKTLILLQFAFSLCISLCALLISQSLAVSLLTGGMIASLANGYFAWKVFAKQQETESAQILSTYYGAEVGKIILTVMLFVFAISVIKPLNVIALMGAYLLITMIPGLASFFVNDDDKNWRDK